MARQCSGMFTDLAYVREELAKIGHAGWEQVSARAEVPVRTIKRIAYRENKDFRASTISKLAMYFRTKERRGR